MSLQRDEPAYQQHETQAEPIEATRGYNWGEIGRTVILATLIGTPVVGGLALRVGARTLGVDTTPSAESIERSKAQYTRDAKAHLGDAMDTEDHQYIDAHFSPEAVRARHK